MRSGLLSHDSGWHPNQPVPGPEVRALAFVVVTDRGDWLSGSEERLVIGDSGARLLIVLTDDLRLKDIQPAYG